MKAIVYYKENDLRLEDKPIPEIEDGGVLVKVKACSICGSDLRTIRHGHAAIKEPRILGHETVGVIEKVGKDVKNYQVGDRVAITPGVGCGECEYCKSGFENMCYSRKTISQHYDGGFTEYVAVPAKAVSVGNLNIIPNNVGFIEASLAEPIACVLNALESLQIEKGDTVVVMGAGPIGIMHCIASKALGASKIILINRSTGRLEAAKKFGFDAYIDLSKEDGVARVKELTNGVGANKVIVAAGSKDALLQAIDMTAKMGKVCMFAGLPKSDPFVNIDVNVLHYRQIALCGTFSSAPRHNKKALELIAEGKMDVKKIITHLVCTERMLEGVEAAENRTAMRVVVAPDIDSLSDEIAKFTNLTVLK